MKFYSKDNFNPTECISFSIYRARKVIFSELDKAFSELGITSQQVGILFALARGMASTPFELSKVLDVNTAHITRMLDKLQIGGLLDRRRSLDDRRVVNLVLTAEGAAMANRIPEIASVALNARVEKFSKLEFDELCRLLGKLLRD